MTAKYKIFALLFIKNYKNPFFLLVNLLINLKYIEIKLSENPIVIESFL